MKKMIAAILSVLLIGSLCACGSGGGDGMPVVFNPGEYALYTNIFYNDQGSDYDGKEVTKIGTFTSLQDRYNDVTRYYVWGYSDQTKCCDWQWELNLTDTGNLPSNGAQVEVKGIFSSHDAALDGYWIESPSISVKQEYHGPDCDVDMTTMSATLERVQLANMGNFMSDFEGQSVYAYGRVYSPTSIEHPYYDGVWVQDFESADTTPAIGTLVIVSGTFRDGVITDGAVSETAAF